MSDTDRVIGELKEFKRATLAELKDLRREVRSLTHFKWRFAGMMASLMGAIEVVRIWLELKP